MTDRALAYMGTPGGSEAFLAALILACRSNCDCEVCAILREAADSLAHSFKPGGGVKPGRRGKT